MSIPTDGEADHRERAVLREWEYLQQSLLTFALATSSSPAANRRLLIEDQIVHSTRGCARLWWEPYTNSSAGKDSWLLEVRYQRIRYGTLELSTGYLVSSMQPHIPQHFAQLCALIIVLAEHEEYVQQQLVGLSPLLANRTVKPLSVHERDLLRGFMNGENEAELANRFGVEKATVHSQIQGLYRRLGVHNPREAIVRIFEHRLVDWLNLHDEKE